MAKIEIDFQIGKFTNYKYHQKQKIPQGSLSPTARREDRYCTTAHIKNIILIHYESDRHDNPDCGTCHHSTGLVRGPCLRTPLLLLHGEEDYRCTREQAEQMFIAMKDRNPEVPVKLVIFPKENHELTRSGNANAQIRHLFELCEWFCRYLDRKEEDADETAL